MAEAGQRASKENLLMKVRTYHACLASAHYCVVHRETITHILYLLWRIYAGLEGMGGLELETDEDENVRDNSFCLFR